jgi:hypothetical protein
MSEENNVEENKVFVAVNIVGEQALLKFFNASCPCGVTVNYPYNGLPTSDTRFPCNNPDHWVVKFTLPTKEEKP